MKILKKLNENKTHCAVDHIAIIEHTEQIYENQRIPHADVPAWSLAAGVASRSG